MTLEQIAELSQTIAALAVLASLIYLALQTRLSAQSQRAMMHADRAEWVGAVMLRIGDPNFAEIWRAGATASATLSPLEAHRFAFFTTAQLVGIQNIYLDWRAGLIDELRWDQTHRAMRNYLRLPGYRATYAIQRANLDAGFRSLVDGYVAEFKGEQGWDTGSAWLTLAAQERAAIKTKAAPESA